MTPPTRWFWAIFREEEGATGYALLVHHISQSHGLPLALYADKHRIFQSLRESTPAEQLEGVEPRTQFGQLLHDLDIPLIAAHSPQAKGRVERLFETLQDRRSRNCAGPGQPMPPRPTPPFIATCPASTSASLS